MKQSCVMSFVEAAISTLVGFGLSLFFQWAFFVLWLELPLSLTLNFTFAVLMTLVSIGRQFVLRRVFEFFRISRPLSPFMQAVIAERFGQVEREGYDAAHDDDHEPGDLALAGAAYAMGACSHVGRSGEREFARRAWPFGEPMKLYDFRRDLVRAAALIHAEGERHDRLRRRGKREFLNSDHPRPPARRELHEAARGRV